MEPRMLTAEECAAVETLRQVLALPAPSHLMVLLREAIDRLAALEPERYTYDVDTGKVMQEPPTP